MEKIRINTKALKERNKVEILNILYDTDSGQFKRRIKALNIAISEKNEIPELASILDSEHIKNFDFTEFLKSFKFSSKQVENLTNTHKLS